MSKVDWSKAPEGGIKDFDAIMVSLINNWQELNAVLSAFGRAGFSDVVEREFGARVIEAKTGYVTVNVGTVYFVRCERSEGKRARRFLTYEQVTGVEKERPKQERPGTVMIGNEFGLALVESLGLDPAKVSSDIKLNVGGDEVFSVDFRVNLTVDEVRKACDIICAK